MVPDMVQARKCGQTVPNMKVSGGSTKRTAKANSGTQMAMSMKDSGKTTKQTATVSMYMSTELSTRVTGEMIFRMALVLNPGQMVLNTRAATKKE